MKYWRQFLDSLDTPGGHIFMLFLLVAGGVALALSKGPSVGEKIFGEALIALILILRGNRKDGNPPKDGE